VARRFCRLPYDGNFRSWIQVLRTLVSSFGLQGSANEAHGSVPYTARCTARDAHPDWRVLQQDVRDVHRFRRGQGNVAAPLGSSLTRPEPV